MLVASLSMKAQSQLYPQHFDLSEVTLLDGLLKDAMVINDRLLLSYDADRLMAPFVRQAGLHNVASGKYYGWLTKHPSFQNWGLSNWSLEGHVGGHYLTALALGYAAATDLSVKSQLKERLDYCLDILKDCQDAYASDTKGLRGFIGGQPINQVWTGLYAGDLTEFRKYGGWCPSTVSTRCWPDCAMPTSIQAAHWPANSFAVSPTGAWPLWAASPKPTCRPSWAGSTEA